MDMNRFRPDSHVAQQSRRDKLRIQQCSNSIQHLEGFSHNLEQSTVNPGIIQVRDVQNANLLFDPSVVSSGIISFSNNSNILSAPRLTMLHQEIGAAQPNNRSIMVEGDMYTNLSNPISPRFNASSRTAGDLQGCGNSWKSLGTQPNADWMVNYSAAVGRDSIQTPTSSKYLKPSYRAYQDVQSNLTNLCGEMSDQYRQKRYEEMHYAPPLYQDVTLASIGSHGLQMTSLVHQNTGEIGHGMWTDSGNELALLPNCGNPSSAIHYENNPMWSNKPDNTSHHWSTEAGFTATKGETEMRDVTNDGTTQGLSLSLSSNPPSKMDVAQFREGYEFQNLHSRTDVSKEQENSRILKSGNPVPIPQPSIISRGGGKSLQELVGTSSHNNYRSTGPLGPFTGYATILRSSRFLKPAQELLEEFCGIRGAKLVDACAVSERVSEDHVSASASAVSNSVDVTDREAGARDNSTSGVSSSTFYSSNQIGCDGGVGSSLTESYRPEYQQKKAKLLHLQEEVCRRYKLYQQQMQMVLSAFEPVVGLSAAAPYVSLAVKTISKNFRCLKIAISNQLKHVTKALGEDLLSSATGAIACRVDMDTSRLNYVDQSFEKHKSAGANLGFFEPQQPVWRPQRGLPERAVAVLRAWLFEHFLHPYPTDTDKHMLATQTGLSRNQVSNWFINARVRVWKPMVEEIYMLETDQKSKKSDGKPDNENANISNNNNNDQPTNRLKGISAMSNEQPDYSGIGGFSLGTQDGLIAERWNQEKRSKGDCQATTSVDRSLMSFIPYHRSGLEVGGLGAVSLTLGLRHGVENSQQHQQQQHQQEDHVRQQLGGQMIHDFVG